MSREWGESESSGAAGHEPCGLQTKEEVGLRATCDEERGQLGPRGDRERAKGL